MIVAATAKKKSVPSSEKAKAAAQALLSKWPRQETETAGEAPRPPKRIKKLAKKGEQEIHVISSRLRKRPILMSLLPLRSSRPRRKNGRTALHAAVIRKDKVITEELLRADRTLSKAADELGCTPLHLAARCGSVSIVKQLLEIDRSTAYIADKDGATALHFAASEGNRDVMKELISQCPDCCELVDKKFQNALYYAIRNKQNQIVEYVFADAWLRNILFNGMDVDGNTPIHHLATHSPKSIELLAAHKVDWMAFNKQNLNAFDILLTHDDDISTLLARELYVKVLQVTGVRPSHGIENPKDSSGNKVEESQRSKDMEESLQKAKDTHLVVATLIATVTFAAGFTMSGGYQSEKGPDQGYPLLSRNTAFKAFVLTDTLAMVMSSCSVLVLLYSSIHTKRNYKGTFQLAVSTTIWALVAMVFAFITGTYAALGVHSSGIAIAGCVLGCIFFSIVANSLLSIERKILDAPHFLDDMVGDFKVLTRYSCNVIIGSIIGFIKKQNKSQ